ncbi:MAG: methylated-DNA--[protein]-cysteine S-methyltransferase [Phycisphaeraceae bacterium]|nr:MAG: methylated-DNA--[protein]-cysteine S-methyltransferase [Phycisphaeraceae bacterium]
MEARVSRGALVSLTFLRDPAAATTIERRDQCDDDAHKLDVLETQLDEYFAGARTTFDIPLALRGTPFQLTAWTALLDIPSGFTETYARLAARIDRPSAARAVGAAVGANPVAIIVPCHRIIGAGNKLTGYAAGIERKRALLELEQAI